MLGPPSPALPPFSLGGPFRMSAFGVGQLRGDRYYYGGVTAFRAFSADPTSGLNRTYLTVGLETANAFRDVSEQTPFYDGFFGITAETRIGAFVAGGALGNKGNHKFFFGLGKIF